jgi:hypothetical protein
MFKVIEFATDVTLDDFLELYDFVLPKLKQTLQFFQLIIETQVLTLFFYFFTLDSGVFLSQLWNLFFFLLHVILKFFDCSFKSRIIIYLFFETF